MFKNIHLIKEKSQFSILKKYEDVIENLVLDAVKTKFKLLPIRTKELNSDAYEYLLEKCMEVYDKNKPLMFELLYNSFKDDFLNKLKNDELEKLLSYKYEINLSEYIKDLSKHNSLYKKTLKLNFIQKRLLEKDEIDLIRKNFHIFNQKVIEKNNLIEKEISFFEVLQNTSDISNKMYNLLEFDYLFDNQDHLIINTFLMEKYINSKTEMNIIRPFQQYNKDQKENIIKAYAFLTDFFNFNTQVQKDNLKKLDLLINSIILDLELNNNNTKSKINKIKI